MKRTAAGTVESGSIQENSSEEQSRKDQFKRTAVRKTEVKRSVDIQNALSPEIQGPEGPVVRIDGQKYHWFRGNGYLGLYGHPELIAASAEATHRYGFKTRVPKIIGCHPVYREFERQALAFFGTETVVFFNSGYSGNGMLTAAWQDRFDQILVDEHAHLSLRDAASLSGKPSRDFRHCDPSDLARLLEELPANSRPLIMSDSIFPASGDLAPLPDYLELLDTYPNAHLLLDDAHGGGVLGENGRGVLEHFGIDEKDSPQVTASLTMSKAFGTFGGIIPCTHALKGLIDRNSGVRRGSCVPPPGILAASAKSLEILNREPSIIQQLKSNVASVRNRLYEAGWKVDPGSPSPLLKVNAPGGDLESLSETLFREEKISLFYLAGGYPGVPEGGCLLFSIFANHSSEQLDHLINSLNKWI